MAIIKAPAFFKKKDSTDQNYLALTITPEKVLALIWNFENDSVRHLGYSQAKYQDSSNLLHQAAVAIDLAGEQTGGDVSQVVFGLSRNWFGEGGQITQETLKLLENMSQDLELKAQAFVPFSVAIKNYLKISENSQPHAVLLGLYQDSCEAHLLKNNQIVASAFAKDKPTSEKVKELVKGLEAKESLPARIIIFAGRQDLDESSLSDLFTQEPKIDHLEEKELAEAIALAQAADILGHEPGIQIASSPKTAKEQKEPDEFGFVEGEDILKEGPQEPVLEQHKEVQEEHVADKVPELGLKIPEPKAGRRNYLDQILTLSWLEKFTSFFGTKGAPKKIAVLAVVLLAIFLAANLILGLTIVKAQINLQVKSEPQEENFSATIADGGGTNLDSKQIAGTSASASASGSQKGVPTGKKKEGNYAKGTVTVFNWTTSQVSFPAQTAVISRDGVKFNLDSSVSVASRSAANPGQTQAPVTAADFGTSGNLAAGTDFSFQKYDELLYSARNDNATSGGDEKEITVVSQDDMDKLSKSLTADLTDKAVQNLKSQNPDKAITGDAVNIEVIKKQFDKNAGEETTLFNLDMEVSASVITYQESELKDLLAAIANQDAPQNLEARGENVEILSENAKRSQGKLNLAGRFRANLIPKFDEGDLKSKLAEKSEKQARAILTQIPQVADVSVKFSPAFLLAPKIPKNPDKVTFKIEIST